MGGHDDYVSNFDDWGAPSPKSFFSSVLVDDINSRSILESNNMLFTSGRDDNKNEPSGGLAGGEFTRLNMYSQQKTNSHGGLMERMAARAGFNAPKLNTENVRPTGLSQNQDARSSLLTIPPGLSPTTLLESPVFLSNAMAQPSPTTGKFPFAISNFSTQEGHDQSRYNFYEDMNTSSFAFNPVPDSGPSNNNFPGFEVSKGIAVSAENSSTPDEQQDEEGDLPLPGGAPTDDGFNWRKYGQKQVKGSEFPRGYYKCTHLNCPAKKKVERSKEGHITEIIYNGAHSHPKPSPSRRSSFADVADGAIEVTSSASFGAESLVEGPPAYLNGDDEEEDDRATRGSVSLDCDGEENESESKRRKVEAYTAADMTGATRAIREPRVVVQTTSEVDILDDGYRWRKYGQKVVKGNPNPRSYYKCTHTGCTVRKHVERASHDLKSVITTYEGKHNHEVPAARNSSHHNNSSNIISNGPSILAHLQRPDQSHTNMPMFDRSPAMGSYGRQQLGPGFSFGMSQQGLANMAMPGMDQHQQNYNGMGVTLPKGEPKVEPFGEASTNLQNGTFSAYHQIMNKFPLGP